MVPEHTWGMDEKTYLADHTRYLADELAELRRTEKCQRFEASWAEQRAYLTAALDGLDNSSLHQEALMALDQIALRVETFARRQRTSASDLRSARFELRFDPSTGAIVRLVQSSLGSCLGRYRSRAGSAAL